MPRPPVPLFIVRTHSSQLNVVSFSRSNAHLYSGDSTGLVTATSTLSRRAVSSWQAHEDGVLGIEEWEGVGIITQGRDNKLHVWQSRSEGDVLGRAGSSSTATEAPKLLYTMDVNALNYCRFSLLPTKGKEREEAWIALPNLTDSETIDIFHLPSLTRPHAAIGYMPSLPSGSNLAQGALDPNKLGLTMSIHLLTPTRLLAGYESGAVVLYEYEGPDGGVTDSRLPTPPGRGKWVVRWKTKIHNEAVMALCPAPNLEFALSVSADHQVIRYDLRHPLPAGAPQFETYKIKQLGNACIAISASSRICAIGGWDGAVRLFSTRTLKPLGTLHYHRDTCHTVAFAQYEESSKGTHGDDDDDDEGWESVAGRARWLATGGTDARVAVWELMDFVRES